MSGAAAERGLRASAAAVRPRRTVLAMVPLAALLGLRTCVPPPAMADYAWGHRGGKQVRVNPGPFAEATYGVKTTAADLLRFVHANIDPAALDAPWRRAIEVTHAGEFRLGAMVQGFGWQQYAWPVSRETLLDGNAENVIFEPNAVQRADPPLTTGPRLFDKTGSTNGFGAYVAFVPAKRVGVVMLANRNFPIAARVEPAYTILDRLAPGPGGATK